MHTMDMENYNIHYDFDNIEVPRSTHLNIEIWELLVPENLFYNERCVGGRGFKSHLAHLYTVAPQMNLSAILKT